MDAPAGAFPEGTELKIRPVVQEAAPLSLFSTLAGTEPAVASAAEVETAVAEAMEAEPEEPLNMVAFDITFVDAEGNELQPAGGQTVSVRFEVEASSGLVSEETGALQVFHVETDGDKNVTSAQPVGDAVAVEDASAGQTVAVEADSFSIYVVGAVGVPETTTYQFYVDGEVVAKQIVKAGDTLLEPEAPVAGDEGSIFAGWYTQQEGGEKFTGFGVVAAVTQGTVNLYARFDTAYYVFYMDGTGTDARVIDTEAYAGDDTARLSAAFPAVETEAGYGNTGWSETPGGDVIATLSINAQDHTLYPVIKPGHWLRFDSQGGTSVDSQFIVSGTSGTCLLYTSPSPRD